MARRDALKSLETALATRRADLIRRLGGERKELYAHGNSVDSADQAFESDAGMVHSQLAQMESRELQQLERALRRLDAGIYGNCEGCGKKIPIIRLEALPYTTTCVPCQRELEAHGVLPGALSNDWGNVRDIIEEPRRINLADFETV